MYAIPTAKSGNFRGSGQSAKTLKCDIISGGNSRRPAIPAGPKIASRFPKSSYVLNPPGTRLKPATAFPNKDFRCPVKEGSWKPSVFRRAWADTSDSSEEEEEEPLACEMPPPRLEAGPNSDRRALTGLSRHAYKRYRKYAFWKVRKGYGQQRPKNPRSCSKSSSDSRSVGPGWDSLSLMNLVDESAHQDRNGAREGNRTPDNVADRGSQDQGPGKSQNNAAVSRCILRAVWSRVAVRSTTYSAPSQSVLAGPLQRTAGNCRDPTVSLEQTARVCARGRSLTPKPLSSNPKPVFSNNRATSLTLRTSWFSPGPVSCPTSLKSSDRQSVKLQSGSCAVQLTSQRPGLGGDLPAQNLHFLVQSSRKEGEDSRTCPGEASFKEFNFGDGVVGSGVPRKDHIARDFDSTKGFPGEGPPVPQPRTPPKGACQPMTPPKAPPKVSGGRPVKLTSSVRRLGPPAKADPGVKTPRVPPKPSPVKSRGTASEPESPSPGVSSAPGKRGSEGAAPIRVVRPKFDTGFNYEEARAKLMSAPGGYPQGTTLPEVRPAVLFNPSTRFTQAVPKVAPGDSGIGGAA